MGDYKKFVERMGSFDMTLDGKDVGKGKEKTSEPLYDKDKVMKTLTEKIKKLQKGK